MKKINMTKNKLVQKFNILSKLSEKECEGVKFKYFLAANVNKIKPEIESIQKAIKFEHNQFKEYQEKTNELIKKYSKKDEEGNPITFENGTQFAIDPNKIEKLNTEKTKLDEEYKDMLEVQKKFNEEVEALMNETLDIELKPIKLSNVPDIVTGNDLFVFFDLIEEEEE